MKTQTLNVIRLFTLCLVFVAGSQMAFAQNKEMMAALKDKTPEQRAQVQTNLMKLKLKLDSPQVMKVQAINFKYAEKMEPVLKGEGGRMAKFKEAKSIAKDKDADLKKVLTDEQYKVYQAFESEMKSKLKERMTNKEM